jgi:cell shape-determining protein MreC
VATTNLEQIVPAGIAVGQVEAVVSKPQDIFLSVTVTSPINPATLSQVFVVSQK